MKDLNYSRLCDMYGTLLTNRQLCSIRDYYDNDMSLTEMADKYGVGSSQVMRTIRLQAENKLNKYENKLQLVQKLYKTKDFLTDNQFDRLQELFF